MSMETLSTVQEDRLLDYLDGRLEGTALFVLKKELESSEVLRLRLEELRIVHRALGHVTLETPSPPFVNKVMQNLHTIPVSSVLSPRNGLLLLAGMIVATGILLAMINAGIFDQVKGLISFEQAVPLQKYFHQSLPVISVDGKPIIKIMIALNLLLAFLVLDRTVLRPFFQRRAGAQL